MCRAASDDDFITRGDGGAGGAAGGAEWADGEDTFSGGEDTYSDGEDAFGSGAAALAGAGFGAEAAAVQAAGSGPGEDDLLDQVRRCLQARRLHMGSCCLLQFVTAVSLPLVQPLAAHHNMDLLC